MPCIFQKASGKTGLRFLKQSDCREKPFARSIFYFLADPSPNKNNIMEITLLAIIVLLLLFIAVQAILNKGKSVDGSPEVGNILVGLQKSLTTIESNLKEDFRINRQEISTIAQENRNELHATLKEFTAEQNARFQALKGEQNQLTDTTASQLEKITGKVELKLKELNDQAKADNNATRETLTSVFNAYSTPKVSIFKRRAACYWKSIMVRCLKLEKNLKPSRVLAEKQLMLFSILPLDSLRLQSIPTSSEFPIGLA